MVRKQLHGVNLRYDIDRDVRSLVFKSTMDVYARIYAPNGVSKSLDSLKLVPL